MLWVSTVTRCTYKIQPEGAGGNAGEQSQQRTHQEALRILQELCILNDFSQSLFGVENLNISVETLSMVSLVDTHAECSNFTHLQVQVETKPQKEKENHKIRSP